MGCALHFDASLVAKYLAHCSQEQGVKRVLGHVERVRMHDDGSIKFVDIKQGERIEADFFFDCSGQHALLLQHALQVGYLDWGEYLPGTGAAVVQSRNTEDLPPYTESIAHEHGWRWRIPLQSRTGNGDVFSDEHCSQEQAVELLLRNIQGEPLGNPRILRFRTRKREKMWRKNCVAIGPSSGFLEPLESTSIYLIMRAALNFVQLLPNRVHCQATEDEYNRLMDELSLQVPGPAGAQPSGPVCLRQLARGAHRYGVYPRDYSRRWMGRNSTRLPSCLMMWRTR
jgi:tryptophan 7-halogenase